MLKENRIFFLSALWVATILSLTGWWAYLLTTIAKKDGSVYSKMQIHPDKFLSMIMWEGGFFILLILLLSATLLYLFWDDRRKTKSLQTFLASVTHELKTPLASIRLQTEVIQSNLKKSSDTTQEVLTGRMLSDISNLEMQFDKILQLSRVELGKDIPLSRIDLLNTLRFYIKQFNVGQKLDVSITGISEDTTILADEFALGLVFKNLFENTIRHAMSKSVTISATTEDNYITIIYRDSNGFDGNINKIGNLFYKHKSPKGSGIGLYLSKKLTLKQQGDFRIVKDNMGIYFLIKLKMAQL